MRLDVLGADGTYPGPGGACSGYLLRQEGFALWIDAGSGTLARLQEHVEVTEVDAVFLSHVHHDHCVDLYAFMYAVLFHPEGRRGIPVIAPPGVEETMALLLSDHARERFGTVFDWRTLEPGRRTEVGPFQIEAFDSVHSAPNLTARVSDGGRVLCYSGDTGPNAELSKAAEASDLFLCEASWQDGDPPIDPIHLRARQAGRAAREAGTARLALTHVWPRHDQALSIEQAADEFDGPIDLASRTDGWDV